MWESHMFFFLQPVKWGDRVEKSVALWGGVLVAVLYLNTVWFVVCNANTETQYTCSLSEKRNS